VGFSSVVKDEQTAEDEDIIISGMLASTDVMAA
jgi:hypothetical protein